MPKGIYNRAGSNRTDYKGKIEKTCETCKEGYRVFQYLKTRQRFCSRKCKFEWMAKKMRGDGSPRWIKDRTKLARRDERNDSSYANWRKQIWLRDNFKCKIANPDCKGRLEAHHILGWKNYPELRYEVNNGIALRHFHHPRKRKDEMRLSPYFQELVGVKRN